MKKTAITILISLAAVAGYAQTADDALMFSENNYEGTARSVAMGNAFTALGGDLGSITINPAGSAVANYSQFAITPSLTFTANTAQGVSPYSDGTLPYFQKAMQSRMTDFTLPNAGLTFNWETGRKSGLKNVTFGFVVNRTNSWNEDVYANGTNATTSFMGALASQASGYLASDLANADAYDFMPWKYVTGFQSGMISTFGGYDDQYVGASEVIYENSATGELDIVVGGPLEQTFGRRVDGAKSEYLFNLGGNISDFVYIGANLGFTSISYDYDEYFMEKAVDQNDFEIGLDNGKKMYFQQMKYNYSYRANGTGVYGKFGIIVTPGAGLRIGAAIQTPTATSVNEFWQMSGETKYTNKGYNATASSPEGEDYYNFSEPWRANFGLAYTLGKLAVFSVDYELCDYSAMKFKRNGFDDGREYFSDLNDDIKDIFGTSHMLRAGVEVKPVDRLAVRAGYGLTTAPELTEVPAAQNASFGLGFNSRKSFFADIACRYAFASDEYFMPYSDYMAEYEVYAPEIRNRKDAWKVLLTLGWRF
jgi:hypothetical protein